MATKQRKIEINYRLLQTSCNIRGGGQRAGHAGLPG